MSTVSDYFGSMVFDDKVMRSMVIKRIAPAIEGYTAELARNASDKKRAFPDLKCSFEENTVRKLSQLTDRIYDDVDAMMSILDHLSGEDYSADSEVIRDNLLPAMDRLRHDSDSAEAVTSKNYWPLPNYGLLLFGEK
jgi:glutamine synthetase